jgi:hypothetical protein
MQLDRLRNTKPFFVGFDSLGRFPVVLRRRQFRGVRLRARAVLRPHQSLLIEQLVAAFLHLRSNSRRLGQRHQTAEALGEGEIAEPQSHRRLLTDFAKSVWRSVPLWRYPLVLQHAEASV